MHGIGIVEDFEHVHENAGGSYGEVWGWLDMRGEWRRSEVVHKEIFGSCSILQSVDDRSCMVMHTFYIYDTLYIWHIYNYIYICFYMPIGLLMYVIHCEVISVLLMLDFSQYINR